jgi:hypothetical protein
MGQYDALVDRLFTSASDRAIGHAFVQKFQNQPFADRLIPALLNEGAAVSQRVNSGELSPEAGRSLVAELAAQAYGLPPSTIADVTAWTNDNLIPDDGTQPAPEPVSAEPPRAFLD